MSTGVVDALVAAVDAHDVDAILARLSADGTLVLPQLDRSWSGPAMGEAVRALLTAFPDLSWRPARRYVGTDGKEFEEGVWSGTNSGALAQHPPSGRGVSVRSRVIYQHDGSLVRRVEVYTDLTAFYRQLGLPTAGLPVSAAEFFTIEAPDEMVVLERPADDPPPGSRSTRGGRRGLAVLAGAAAIVLVAGVAFGVVRSVRANTGASGPASPPASPPSASPSVASATPTPTATPAPAVTTQGNRVIVSADVLFATGSATLSPGAQQVIGQVVAILRQRHVQGDVRVYGYTDDVGPAGFNMTLSQARANSVVAALHAAAPSLPIHYVAAGFGEQSPVASNATAAGRARNRRVTILLPTAK